MEGQFSLDVVGKFAGVGVWAPYIFVQFLERDLQLFSSVLFRQLSFEFVDHEHINFVSLSFFHLFKVLFQEIQTTLKQNFAFIVLL